MQMSQFQFYLGSLWFCLMTLVFTGPVLLITVSSPTLCTCSRPFSLQSDWRRFLYGSESLCEHTRVFTHAVVISNISSLNSIDGQSEFRFRSAAAEMTRSTRIMAYFVKQQFRRLSRFLQVPTEIIINSCTGCTAQRDRLSHSNSLWCRRLSHRWTGAWAWR